MFNSSNFSNSSKIRLVINGLKCIRSKTIAGKLTKQTRKNYVFFAISTLLSFYSPRSRVTLS